MTRDDMYTVLTVCVGVAVLALTGPGFGLVFAWLSRRSWNVVWDAANAVEAGGLTVTRRQKEDAEVRVDAEAKIQNIRRTRQRTMGVCISSRVWRTGTDAHTKEAFATFCAIPSVGECRTRIDHPPMTTV
jgi:hypothetical protein